VHCSSSEFRLNPHGKNYRASISEKANLREVDYRAIGIEPLWQLEIGLNSIVTKTGYELSAQAYLLVKPTSENQQISQYQIHTENRQLTVFISAGYCADSMSGEEFGSKVVIRVDDLELTGCGRPLD